MPVKATLRRPPPPAAIASAPPAQTSARPPAPIIDVEATVSRLETPEQLAEALESGSARVEDGQVVVSTGEEAITRTASPTAVGPVRSIKMGEGSGFEGDWDQSDLRLPQLKIVNGSGELSQKFNQGSLLYADEKLWNPPSLEPGAKNPSMLFVPIQIKKQFRENLSPEEVDDGAIPRIVNNSREADALRGPGSTLWTGGEKPAFSPSARCVFLLQQPEGVEHPAFCNELDGKLWALAVYYASGMAYNESAKQIFNAAQISLKENGKIVLPKKVWMFEVVKKTGGKFTVFVPKVRTTKEETGPQARALAEVVNGVNIQTEE